MESLLLAFVKPFFMLVLFGVFVIPLTLAFKRWFPESRLKTWLLDRTISERYPLLPLLGCLILFFWIGFLR